MIEINGMRVFGSKDLGGIRKIEEEEKRPFVGYFYVLEYSDSVVKIGSTRHPIQRLDNLAKTAENYGNWNLGRFALSQPHTNYRRNETMLHKYFSEYRRSGSELFDFSFGNIVKNIPSFIVYENESDEMKKRSSECFENTKRFILGDLCECVKESKCESDPGKIAEIIEIVRKYILGVGGTPQDVVQAAIEINWAFGVHNSVLDEKYECRYNDAGGEQA